MNDSPEALQMAYGQARNEALASGQYPYKTDDQGNLIDAGSGNGERPVQNFSQPNQPTFNGPPIHNARRFTTVPAGGKNREVDPGGIKQPQTEEEFGAAWKKLMENAPGYGAGDGQGY